MADVSVEMDQFGHTLSQILDDVEGQVKNVTPKAVKAGLKKGASEWRKKAPVRRGKYKRSIRYHMTDESADSPAGEIGSASMPGLPHLLEKGHARVGGGRVPGIPHIEPASEVAFDETERVLIEEVDNIL